MATQSGRPRHCTYCPDPGPGADVCVRTHPSPDGGTVHVFAHRSCAARRGDRPHYVFTDEGEAQR